MTTSLAGCEVAEYTQGEASVVFFYMGDSRFTTLFQEMTRLNKALKGYDRKILLKHQLSPQNVSSTAARNNADRVVEPTRSNFVDQLRTLFEDRYTIDLFVFSHGTRDSFKMSNGSHGTEDWFTKSDVEGLVGSGGSIETLFLPLRLVHQVNCWGSNLAPAWEEVGAEAATGARYVNFFPHQFETFASEWRSGSTVRDAYDTSNTAASRSIVHSALATADAPATKSQWGGCPIGRTILGTHSCAKDYYIDRWGHDASEWTSGKSGKWNINHASEQQFEGDATRDNSSYYNE